MSKTAAELLLEMDAKATKGPWGPNEYDTPERGVERVDRGTLASPSFKGGDDEWDTDLLAGRADSGWFKVEDDRDVTATLRNALPQLAAVCAAAVALRKERDALMDILVAYRMRRSPKESALDAANGLREAAERFDAALADLTAALGEKP